MEVADPIRVRNIQLTSHATLCQSCRSCAVTVAFLCHEIHSYSTDFCSYSTCFNTISVLNIDRGSDLRNGSSPARWRQRVVVRDGSNQSSVSR